MIILIVKYVKEFELLLQNVIHIFTMLLVIPALLMYYLLALLPFVASLIRSNKYFFGSRRTVRTVCMLSGHERVCTYAGKPFEIYCRKFLF